MLNLIDIDRTADAAIRHNAPASVSGEELKALVKIALANQLRESQDDDAVWRAWTDLCEKDDRSSPEEYPDMCLITKDELAKYIRLAKEGKVL